MKYAFLLPAAMLFLGGCGVMVATGPRGGRVGVATGPLGGKIVAVEGPGGGKAAVVQGPGGKRTAIVKSANGPAIIVKLPSKPKEAKPPKPKIGKHVWVAGHFEWNNAAQRYRWEKGHWERTILGKRWVPGKYAVIGNINIWKPGHWE